MREEGYHSVQIRKSVLAALESAAVRLSVSALAIWCQSRFVTRVHGCSASRLRIRTMAWLKYCRSWLTLDAIKELS